MCTFFGHVSGERKSVEWTVGLGEVPVEVGLEDSRGSSADERST
jgi:hypothetical protein